MNLASGFDLEAFARRLAADAGIPDVLLSAVVERAERAEHARQRCGGVTPLRGSASGLVIVSSLDGIEEEIELSVRALCRRVVRRAAEDHARGVLERRCV